MASKINKKGSRNPTNPLFQQLTKLLSGPLVNYRRQDTRKLKRRQLDKYKTRFRSASGKEFKLSSYDDIYGSLQADFYASQNRIDRYVDFDQMEYTPEIASAMDIYADEMTTSSVYRPILNIICSNQEIKAVLETLFYNVLNVEFNLYGWSRSMCKYGDYFLYLDIEEDQGIKNVIGLPVNEVERLEGEDKNNPNYVQYQWNTAGLTLENWQMGHFRILGNDKFAPYGTSILEPARRIWRQLTLIEDAVMAYRVVRSPDRRVFYIDVGNIPPEDVEQYMQRVMTQMKRNQIVDVNSGRVDLRYNPLSVEEDYYIPVRGQASNTRIESLGGGKYTGDIEDLKYLRDKLFSALKIPMSYLSRGDGQAEDKSTLAQKDIRFARTIQRLQRSVVSELEKIAIVHLFTMGYRGNDLLSFKLNLNNPSKLAELQELEHWKARFDAAGNASEGYFSRRWIAKNILNVQEEEFERMQNEMFYDRKHDFALEQVGEAMAAAAGGGGGAALPGLEGEAGAAPDAGDIDLPEPEATPEPEAPADTGPLLATPGAEPAAEPSPAAPGKRDDEVKDKFGRTVRVTKGAKGKKYRPVVGEDGRSGPGARIKSRRGSYAGGPKSSFPGSSEIKSIAKMTRLSENVNANYNEQEQSIFNDNSHVKKLIESLERSTDEAQSQ
tara:strand:+ start:2010 stop:4004 length:1995 start_codon:yes stop_codon:yes gene_type:complete